MLVVGMLIVEPRFHEDLPPGNSKGGKGKEEIATC
jgi:hypothetical protein